MTTKAVHEAMALGMFDNGVYGKPLWPAEHRILQNLASRSNNQWKVGAHLMSQETWAKSMGMTDRHLRRAIDRLDEYGYVTVLDHDRPKGRGVTTYRLSSGFVAMCERWLKEVGKHVDKWWLRAEKEGVKAASWEDLVTAYEPSLADYWLQ